ncbi:MAG: gliding motility protein [Flavobacteriaceae bacterium]|nr:gliding motility protein [Flavobacteriaceae bacterium]
MKNNILKYLLPLAFFIFLIACSTRKDTFISRNIHALSAKDNILYNGQIALDKGVSDLKGTYKDNFWELLSIERMQVNKGELNPGETKNANFERAETKATKAIQKHSMNINGIERNSQMDEAYLLLGKTRYYDQRFIPALEAFNYILYKSPGSDKIHEAKIWREKTNMRLENDALALKNMQVILKDIKLKNQVFADANATISQAFMNVGKKDSAIASLKLATQFTKSKEEKARYNYILAQLYEDLGYKDSAFVAYQFVIDMKRKSPRQYIIHAQAKQAQLTGFENTDSISFLKKFNKLLKERENRPFLDVLHHQMALYYDKNKKFESAKKEYNKSLKSKTGDTYTIASNYRNLADIYFNKSKYPTAGKYFDSTLVQLNQRTREHRFIKKKRENLNDVIKYEGIANRNDSILNVVGLSDSERIAYYEKHIIKLKKEDDLKKNLAAAVLEKEKNNPDSSQKDVGNFGRKSPPDANGKSDMIPPGAMQGAVNSGKESDFYFYNQKSVAYGKLRFKKIWGDRAYKNNWRLSSEKANVESSDIADSKEDKEGLEKKIDAKVEEKYTAAFYMKEIPKNQIILDSIAKQRNFAYFQLGTIYKEKFKEYQLAANKLEQLLKNNPEERLVLPSMYNLFKIYEIINKVEALAMKERIISQYPNSRYAQILSNTNPEIAGIDTPEKAYNKLYKLYESGDYRIAYSELEKAVDQYMGEELLSKFDLLKANTMGKLNGIIEFKKALNFVALNYPNSEEGKKAEALLKNNVPLLESFKFYAVAPKSWKILFKITNDNEKNNTILINKINLFVTSNKLDKLHFSNDIYTMTDNFIVIHGIISEEFAKGITAILKDYKDYKIPQTPIIISNYNYQVVQINKNIEEYLTTPVVAPSAIQNSNKVAPIVPSTKVLPNNLEAPDANPTDFPEKNNGDILPPLNKGNGNPTPILGQGTLETDQMIKPKK